MEVLVLESVGSCIDKEGIVYPTNADFDKYLGCHLEDIADEWLESLSIKDTRLLHKWLIKMNKRKEGQYE